MMKNNIVLTVLIILIYTTILFVSDIYSQSNDGVRGVDIGMKLGTIIGAIAGFIFLIRAFFKRSQDNKEQSIEEDKIYECSECNADVREEDKICPKCGAQLDDNEEDEKNEEVETYECSECNADIKEEDKFCRNCGAQLDNNNEDSINNCSNCGEKYLEGQDYCGPCGNPLKQK